MPLHVTRGSCRDGSMVSDKGGWFAYLKDFTFFSAFYLHSRPDQAATGAPTQKSMWAAIAGVALGSLVFAGLHVYAERAVKGQATGPQEPTRQLAPPEKGVPKSGPLISAPLWKKVASKLRK
jgi:hypothetical protein